MPASAAPSPVPLWLAPASAVSPLVPEQLSAGTDGEQDRRTQPGYTEFLSLSLQGIILNSQLCYTYNTDTSENRTAVQRSEGYSSWQYHHPKKNRKQKSPHKTVASHTHCHYEFNKQWLEPALKPQWMLQGMLV